MQSISKLILNQLMNIYDNISNDKELSSLVNARDEILVKYQKVFSVDNLNILTEEEIKDFLLFKNNKHWVGLHRMSGYICKDINKTREALIIL